MADSGSGTEPEGRTPSLDGERVHLRAGGDGDVEPLVAMFAEPSVLEWWFAQDATKVAARIAQTDQFGWVIEAEGAVLGWIQAGEEDDEEYRAAWIDIAVRTSAQGTGVAADALRTVMSFLVEERGHHRVTIDPDVENSRAVRAYEKVGFRRVGVMRRYCRRPDGSFGDGLLMEHVVGIDPPIP